MKDLDQIKMNAIQYNGKNHDIAEDAIALAQEAYETVTKRHQSRLGVRKPIRSLSGGKLGGSPVPEPKSLMDAVQNALAAGGS